MRIDTLNKKFYHKNPTFQLGLFVLFMIGFLPIALANNTILDEICPIDLSNIAASYETCDGSNDAKITLFPSGGNSPYIYEWSNGGDEYEITGLSTGTYYVTVTDEDGCESETSIDVELSPEGVWVMLMGEDASCAEGNNGLAHASVMTGTAPFDIQWSNGMSGEDITGLSPGTYSVTVTDANGCSNDQESIVIGSGNTTIDLSNNAASFETCAGSNDAKITLFPEGGEAPYSYEWSNGGDSYEITGLSAGTYSVTVTDDHGCSATTSMEVELSPEGVWIMLSGTDATCSGENDGTAHVSVMTGTAPFEIQWSNGMSGEDISDLAPGTYTVTVTDANNCSNSESITIGTDVNIEISVSTSDASCNGNDGSASVSISGGEEPYMISWSNGESGTSIDNLSAGSYSVTVKDNNGCDVTKEFTIGQEDSDLEISVSTSDASCNGNDGSASVSISGGEEPFTISWSNGELGTSINNLSAGSYTVTVKGNNCMVTESFTIGQDDNLSVELSTTNAGCNLTNGSATVTVSGGTEPYIIVWSDGQSGLTASNLAPGAYSVTIADNTGCSEIIDPVVIGEEDCPPIECEADAGTLTTIESPICFTGSSVNIGSTPNGDAVIPFGFQVLYVLTSGPDLVIQSASPFPNFIINATGSYTIHTLVFNPMTLNLSGLQFGVTTGAQVNALLIQGGGDICASLDLVGAPIEVITCCDPPVLVSVVVIETPCGESAGSATIDVQGAEADYTFSWTPNVSDTYFANNIPSGTYTVIIADQNDASCNITEVFTVGTINGPDVTVETSPANCSLADGQARLGPDSLKFVWNDGSMEYMRNDLAAGVYQVEVSTSSDPDCISLITVVIDEINNISVAYDIVALPDCNGANGSVQINASPDGDYSYTWSDGGSGELRNDLAAGTYSVTVSDNDASECQTVVSVILPNGEEAICTITNDPTVTCAGDTDGTVMFDINYSPLFVNPPTVDIFDDNNMEATNGELAPGNYCIVITDGDGCIQGGSCFEVASPDPINVDVAITNASCSPDGTITLVEVIGGNGDYVYDWADIDGTDDPRDRTGLAEGTYSVTVTDGKGCLVAINALAVTRDCPCEAEAGGMVGGESPVCFENGMAAISATSDGNAVIPDGYVQIFVLTSGAELVIIDVNTTGSFMVNNLGLYTIHSFVYNPDDIDLLTVVQPGVTTGFDVNELLIQGGGTLCASLDVPGAPIDVVDCCENPIITSVVVIEAHCGQSDGSAVVNLAGTGPYIYEWDPNVSSTNSADTLVADTYELTITDATDPTCSITEIFTVGNADGPDGNAVIELPANCGVANGTIVFAPDSLTYAWSDMGMGASRSDLAAGTYQVTITNDVDDCFNVKTVVVEEMGEPEAEVIMVNSRPTCGESNGSVTVGIVGGSNDDYTFVWDDGIEGTTRIDLAAGTHHVTIRSNNSSCTTSLTFVLLNAVPGDAVLSVDAAATTSVSCIGDTDGAVSFTVDYDPNFALPGDTTIVDAVTGVIYENGSLPAGEYCLIIRDGFDCVAGGACFKIGSPEQIDVDIAVIEAGCDSVGMITIVEVVGGNSPYTFDWADIDNAINMKDRTDLPAGDYTITVTDSKGCAVSATVNVAGENPFTMALPDSLVVCLGQMIDINPNGNADFSYTWSPATGLNDSMLVNPTFSGTETTTYSVVAVNATGNCTVEDEIRVVVPTPIEVNISPRDSSWCLGPATLTASSNTGVSYQWTDVNGAEVSPSAIAIVSPPSETEYFLEVTDVYGCSVKDSTTAEVIVQNLQLPPDTVRTCPGMPMALNPDGTPGLVYQWSPADSLDNANAVNPTPISDSTLTFTVIISDSTGACQFFDTVEYIVPSSINLTIGGSRISCNQDEMSTFTASSNAADTYTWATDSLFMDVVATGNSFSTLPEETGQDPITYYVLAENNAGCSAIDSFTLVNRSIVGGITPQPLICKGDSLLIFADLSLAADEIQEYNWLPTESVVSFDGNVVTVSPATTSNVFVEVSNQFGCMFTDSVTINVNTFGDDLFAFPNRDSIIFGDTTGLNVTLRDEYTYAWSNSNSLDEDNVHNPISTPIPDISAGTGIQDYVVAVTDTSGCTFTQELRVTVFDPQCGPPNIFIPNAFSPNGDGMNDVLYVRGFNMTDVYFVIYNRWGEKVFESRDQDIGWDGTFKNEELSSDVYGYYMRAVCRNGNEYTKQGNISLFR